jgi:tRNA U34 5-carboxymethylaminomethyl modifying GTPase MnmE/TrmE
LKNFKKFSFQKFEPKNKPIVIYDSKGLEWKEHKSFIEETGKFFDELRSKEDVSEHIHVVWYVINTGRGRIEDFEADIVRKVFNPTPVIFILNKVDLADSKAIKAVKEVIEAEKLPNNKGLHLCVANRKTYTQSWCPKCISDDVFFDEETKELECSECSFTIILEVFFFFFFTIFRKLLEWKN